MPRRAPARARRRLDALVAAFVILPAVLLANGGCSTDGTTPDCSLPNTHCGPDFEGGSGEGAADEAGETGADTAVDGGNDAPGDAKIDGDAAPD